jgi:hypothetical protein
MLSSIKLVHKKLLTHQLFDGSIVWAFFMPTIQTDTLKNPITATPQKNDKPARAGDAKPTACQRVILSNTNHPQGVAERRSKRLQYQKG